MPLALFLTAAAAFAQPQTGNVIRGKVRNRAGTSVGHVIVMLHAGGGGLVNQAVTNEEGDFYFAGLSGTSYTVAINHPGHEPYTEGITFTRMATEGQPGEMKTMFITLEAPAPDRVPPARVVFAQQVPVPARAAFERGAALSKLHRSKEAIAAYEEAVAAFANYFDAHFALASELMRANRFVDSMRSLEAARTINPRDERVYAVFGLVLIRQGKFAVAAAAFGEAARMRPDEPNYPFMRAGALIEQARVLDREAADRPGLLAAAEVELARVDELSGKRMSAVRLQRARVYEHRGDAGRAADELALYLREYPDAGNASEIREAIRELRAKQ